MGFPHPENRTVFGKNIHGFPIAPLPIITPSHPVVFCIKIASAAPLMSPFPMTGKDYRFFYFFDNGPVSGSAKPLDSGPWMDSDGIYSACIGNFSNVKGLVTGPVPSGSHFYGQGNGYRFSNRLYQSLQPFWAYPSEPRPLRF